MNKIDFSNTGGFPLVVDDLDFMQVAWRNFGQLLSGVGNPQWTLSNGLILSGCQVTANAVTSGWVLLDNELLKLDATTFPSLSTAFIVLDESTDPAGTKVFADGSIHDVYLARKARVWSTPTPPMQPYIKLDNPCARIESALTQKDITSPFDVSFSLDSAWTASTPVPAGVAPLLITKQFGRVQFRGAVRGAMPAGSLIGNLGVGFRPIAQGLMFLCPYGNGIARVGIGDTGTVSLDGYPVPATLGDELDLSGILFAVE